MDAVLRKDGDPIPFLEVQPITKAVRQPSDPLIEGAEGHTPVVGDIYECLALWVEQRGFGGDATEVHRSRLIGTIEVDVAPGYFPCAIDFGDLIAVYPGGQQLGFSMLGGKQREV